MIIAPSSPWVQGNGYWGGNAGYCLEGVHGYDSRGAGCSGREWLFLNLLTSFTNGHRPCFLYIMYCQMPDIVVTVVFNMGLGLRGSSGVTRLPRRRWWLLCLPQPKQKCLQPVYLFPLQFQLSRPSGAIAWASFPKGPHDYYAFNEWPKAIPIISLYNPAPLFITSDLLTPFILFVDLSSYTRVRRLNS